MRYLLPALALFPLPAMAEVYTVASAPTAVTVYGGFAMVTRDVRLEVGAGAHEVILPDLPQWIDPGSLRVSLTGATLASTRLRNDALPPQPDSDSAAVIDAKARIDAAERALRDLDDRIQDAGLAAQGAAARISFLSGLASSETLPSEPQALAELAQMVGEQTLIATRAQLQAQRDARALGDGRAALETDLSDARAALAALTPPAVPQALLALGITAAQEGTVMASVSYPVAASWQPTYDIILQEEAETITLRRAALVSQNSGENWEGVALTLSTLAPNGQVVPSELSPTLLQFVDPLLRAQPEVQRSSAFSDLTEAGAPAPVMEALPQVSFDGPGVSYAVAGAVTIAQNAEGLRVALDTMAWDARVFARAVPRRDTTAFRMAEATNDSREPLLAAATAQLFVDGTLVGRAPFAAVAAGARFTQAFGPIEDLRLDYAVLDRSAGDRGIISRSNAQTQEVRLTIENLGSDAWDVELHETVPYSEQDDLLINWSAEPQADAVNLDDMRGLVQWDLALAPQTTQVIEISQTVRWPDGKVLR